MTIIEHTCDERTLDYSTLRLNYIACTVCPRRYVFNQWRGWMMQPAEPRPDRREPDYWFSRTPNTPPPTEVQKAQRRERRLQKLAKIEEERREQFSETDAAVQRLRARTGGKVFNLAEARARKEAAKKEKPHTISLTHTSVFRRLKH